MSKLILLLMPYSTGHTVVSFQYVLWKKDSIFTIRLYNIVQGVIIGQCIQKNYSNNNTELYSK